jgi:hypothetical protein
MKGRDKRKKGAELMPAIGRVVRYSGLDFYAVSELPYDIFLSMLRASVISDLMQSKAGQDILEVWERVQCTELDVEKFREHMKA